MDEKSKGPMFWAILAVIAVIVIVPALYLIFLLGRATQPPEVRDDPGGSLRAAAPEWTPDGARIVFGHGGSIYVVNQDGSALNRIHGSGGDDDLYHTPILSGDGSRVGYSKYRRGRWTRRMSALDGSDVRETAQNFDDRGFNAPWGYKPYGISRDRSRIAFVEGAALYMSEYPGSSSDVGTEENRAGWVKLVEGGSMGSPRWSPDGSRIAFMEIDDDPDDNNSALYSTRIVSSNGSDLKTVHQSVNSGYQRGYLGHEVAWSPDGTKLLTSGSSSISVVNADGSGLRTLVELQDNPIRQLHPSWSPDGSMIAVYNGNAYEGVLFTMSPDGSNKRVLTEYGDPLRLAQNQSWDPAFDATPTPTVTPTPNAFSDRETKRAHIYADARSQNRSANDARRRGLWTSRALPKLIIRLTSWRWRRFIGRRVHRRR